jgi:antitoxin (DNA-binding transcriptional repressor) of toxin-antitoxin stability system
MEDNIMKFLSVRDLRGKSAQIWKELPGEREMIITSNGRPIAILASISESNLEESLAAFRRARAVDAVASLQRRSICRPSGTVFRSSPCSPGSVSRHGKQGSFSGRPVPGPIGFSPSEFLAFYKKQSGKPSIE